MEVILAIDAAWTTRQPRGAAVLVSSGKSWRCAGVAPSYASFFALGDGVHIPREGPAPPGGDPNAEQLLQACARLAGRQATVVAVDMPVATVPISGRRPADDEVSRNFGASGCSTHSPSASRPGNLGAKFTETFVIEVASLATTTDPSGTEGRLIEVYPIRPCSLSLIRNVPGSEPGGEGGIRTHGTVNRTTDFEFGCVACGIRRLRRGPSPSSAPLSLRIAKARAEETRIGEGSRRSH